MMMVCSLCSRNLLPMTVIKRARNKMSHADEGDVLKLSMDAEYQIGRMSKISSRIQMNTDAKEVARRRRNTYSYLSSMISGLRGAVSLYPAMPDNVVPYNFPLLVENPRELQLRMEERGIETEISVNRPYREHPLIINGDERFEEVEYLADHVLSIPIHQSLHEKHIKYIGRVLQDSV